MFININLFYVLNFLSVILLFICLFFFSDKKKFLYSIYCGFLGILIPVIYYIFILKNKFLFFLVISLFFFTGLIGWLISSVINITSIPELITLMHSFIGLSAVVIGYNNIFLYKYNNIINILEIFFSNLIGSITFIGSIISYLKLINIRLFNNFYVKKKFFCLNIFILILLLYFFLKINYYKYFIWIYFMIFLVSIFLGFNILNSLDSSDIPIVISLLNAYSGLSSVISGFILNNNLLIIIGSLVSSSGFILSKKMCVSMNRSIYSIIFGKIFYSNIKNKDFFEKKNVNKLDLYYVKNKIISFKELIIVPGYGMAVSQSQNAIFNLMKILINKYLIKIKFIIHPIAGRLPGHMNLLLAEVNIKHKYIYSLNQINDKFMKNKLVLVIGANDIINPRAYYDKNCVLYGMPIIKIWKSKFCIIFKKNIYYNTGFSKIYNPIFFKKNVGILFGDAKINLENILNLI